MFVKFKNKKLEKFYEGKDTLRFSKNIQSSLQFKVNLLKLATDLRQIRLPVAFHPGEYLKMELEARNIKQKDFAEVLDISAVEISMIINGKRNITPRLAARIGEAFGTGPELRINLQTAYDLRLLKQNKTEVKRRNIITKKMFSLTGIENIAVTA